MARTKDKSSDTLAQRLAPVRSGKANLVLISAKTPPLRRSELEDFAMLRQAPVHHFNGTNAPKIEMGTACGRLFRCGLMVALDAGDSDILADQAVTA
ncbi:60S ribosomal protein L30 [Colletotrichum spinosum]|uniref:60S ribosomal protein L30 n=1 Tax=Colletotrichum spinosum TaxID=1347390 RepID=A0A4R8Q956_9PEZI|nr:60S ribosomal protein L30 [Colletotrichum spinosum]